MVAIYTVCDFYSRLPVYFYYQKLHFGVVESMGRQANIYLDCVTEGSETKSSLSAYWSTENLNLLIL